MPVIRPSHHCFDDMIEYVLARVRADPALAHGTSLQLVHGLVSASPAHADVSVTDGKRFAHAWVEDRDADDGHVVVTSGLLEGELMFVRMTRAEFAAQLHVHEATAYTVHDVWRENRRHRTTGPWLRRYRVRCRKA